jgi:carbon monoxide dehydrogenase subunit G
VEIEKTLVIPATTDEVWGHLLDPELMAACVPGMQSVEVISPTEYVARMQVGISFVTAKFKLRTVITEQDKPNYLRAEGTGEDRSIGSSLKQRSEMWLVPLPGDQTELRLKVTVTIQGKLGSFGLSVMKTKADLMWEEFGKNLIAQMAVRTPGAPVQRNSLPGESSSGLESSCAPQVGARQAGSPGPPVQSASRAGSIKPVARRSWLSTLLGHRTARDETLAQPFPASENVLITIILKHHSGLVQREIQSRLAACRWWDRFPIPGTRVVSWTVAMGLGQVVILEVPPHLLGSVNAELEQSAWSVFETQCFPTYDFAPIRERIRSGLNSPVE